MWTNLEFEDLKHLSWKPIRHENSTSHKRNAVSLKRLGKSNSGEKLNNARQRKMNQSVLIIFTHQFKFYLEISRLHDLGYLVFLLKFHATPTKRCWINFSSFRIARHAGGWTGARRNYTNICRVSIGFLLHICVYIMLNNTWHDICQNKLKSTCPVFQSVQQSYRELVPSSHVSWWSLTKYRSRFSSATFWPALRPCFEGSIIQPFKWREQRRRGLEGT